MQLLYIQHILKHDNMSLTVQQSTVAGYCTLQYVYSRISLSMLGIPSVYYTVTTGLRYSATVLYCMKLKQQHPTSLAILQLFSQKQEILQFSHILYSRIHALYLNCERDSLISPFFDNSEINPDWRILMEWCTSLQYSILKKALDITDSAVLHHYTLVQYQL